MNTNNLTPEYITQEIRSQQVLAVHQMAILDFLNAAKTPEDIAGVEPGEGPIMDDPNHRSAGYDIGYAVAQHILDRRNELGEFTDLTQLAGIPYFGVDKFNDLLYSFLNYHVPLPSGKGESFDQFVAAVAALELDATRRKISRANFLTVIRKLFYDNKLSGVAFEWNQIFSRADAAPPAAWGVKAHLKAAKNQVINGRVIQVDGKNIDVHTLLAGLDGQRSRDTVNIFDDQFKLSTPQAITTYVKGIGMSIYNYLDSNKVIFKENTEISDERLSDAFYSEMTAATLHGIADAYTMNYDANRSLVWNLLNYYTEKESPSKQRFENLANKIGLGAYQDGKFMGDTLELRMGMQNDIVGTSLLISQQNRRASDVEFVLSIEDSPTRQGYTAIGGWATDKFIDTVELYYQMEKQPPTILSWNRLEARPRTQDFVRPLSAEVRDALWFLSRQWQVGEFKGEDTGSAIEMRVKMKTSSLQRYANGSQSAEDYSDDVPLEALVERQVLPEDLNLSLEMGRHWERLLRASLGATTVAASTINNIWADFLGLSAFQYTLPSPALDHPDLYSNSDLMMVYALAGSGRMLNGMELYHSLKAGSTASSLLSGSYSATAVSATDTAGDDFITWFETTYAQVDKVDDSAWHSGHLEYQFACSTPDSSSSMSVMVADEYASGHLDWYSFDFETDAAKYDPDLHPASPDTSKIDNHIFTIIPSELRYPGMPLPRWWQMEDFKVNFEEIQVNTTDPAKLVLTEFATLYSNDWMLLPYPVQVGSLCDVESIVVKDVFGQYTNIQAAGAGDNDDWQRWAMFDLYRRVNSGGAADNRLFIPPAIVKPQESKPVEKISFLRDEMANMAWGVETIVPDLLGGGMDGYEAALRRVRYLTSQSTPTTPVLIDNDAKVTYELGNTVPENWIPFIPVRDGGTNSRNIKLQRAAMPRIINDLPVERVRPRTELLRYNFDSGTNLWSPYYIHEEEIPRSGTLVMKSWQRTRWYNGKTVCWMGLRKKNGRGEANSGLEFDRVVDKE